MARTRRLYLIRHGEVSNPNHVVYGDLPGFHLSAMGVQQVHLTGVHIADFELDLILSSPLSRAVETATAIARYNRLDPVIDIRLTESEQFPHWTGNKWDSIPHLFPNELEDYLEDAENAGGREQLDAVAQRYMAAALDAFARGYRHVAMVGHQDPVQATRLSLTGVPLSELRIDPPHHGEVIVLVGSAHAQWVEASRWHPDPLSVEAS